MRDALADVAIGVVHPPGFVESVAGRLPESDVMNVAERLFGWWIRHALLVYFVPDSKQTGDGRSRGLTLRGLIGRPNYAIAGPQAYFIGRSIVFDPVTVCCYVGIGLEGRILGGHLDSFTGAILEAGDNLISNIVDITGGLTVAPRADYL